ncbi:MAG TPA: hypothetical protein VNO30_13620 [Kofleriaceae bacterium]|nr:hypothetical protein [Kofleriaceae bacterium]
MLAAVPGVPGRHGARVALGANWLQALGEVATETGRNRKRACLPWSSPIRPSCRGSAAAAAIASA